MQNNLTQIFAQFACELRCDAITADARERCKDLLLDAFACALAGYAGEDAPKVARFAAALGQSPESSVIGGARLTLPGATALNGFTRGAAYAGFAEKKIGSLEPGKWADFILVDRDVATVDPQALAATKVLETWVAGKKVFSADATPAR